jgi:hypothetical protein
MDGLTNAELEGFNFSDFLTELQIGSAPDDVYEIHESDSYHLACKQVDMSLIADGSISNLEAKRGTNGGVHRSVMSKQIISHHQLEKITGSPPSFGPKSKKYKQSCFLSTQLGSHAENSYHAERGLRVIIRDFQVIVEDTSGEEDNAVSQSLLGCPTDALPLEGHADNDHESLADLRGKDNGLQWRISSSIDTEKLRVEQRFKTIPLPVRTVDDNVRGHIKSMEGLQQDGLREYEEKKRLPLKGIAPESPCQSVSPSLPSFILYSDCLGRYYVMEESQMFGDLHFRNKCSPCISQPSVAQGKIHTSFADSDEISLDPDMTDSPSVLQRPTHRRRLGTGPSCIAVIATDSQITAQAPCCNQSKYSAPCCNQSKYSAPCMYSQVDRYTLLDDGREVMDGRRMHVVEKSLDGGREEGDELGGKYDEDNDTQGDCNVPNPLPPNEMYCMEAEQQRSYSGQHILLPLARNRGPLLNKEYSRGHRKALSTAHPDPKSKGFLSATCNTMADDATLVRSIDFNHLC